MNYGFLENWHDFLPREGGHVVVLSGNGDLSLVVRQLEGFYAELGVDVTRCEPPDGPWPGSRIDALRESSRDRVILVTLTGGEDTGSWPRSASLALLLMAGERVGHPVHDALTGDPLPARGRELLAASAAGELWSWDHLGDLLTGPGGYLEQVPGGVPVACGITGLEEVADSIGLFALADELMSHPRLPLLMFVTADGDRCRVRTAYRDGGTGSRA